MLFNCISGLVGALAYPSISVLTSQWAPVNERSILCSIANLGSPLGLTFGALFTGQIVDSSLGWRSVYYIYGSVAIVWFIIFFTYFYYILFLCY